MECRGEVLLDAEFCCERLSKVGCETGIPVANDFAGESEPSVDVVEV